MSLKSIRESYSKLLTTFNDAGIKLNESQKSDLDAFVLALESTMSKQRQDAIRKTKKAVTEKLESEYKTIFESILRNQAENSRLASQIQTAAVKMNESKKIANKVNDYLDLYVESILPKKTIVDYDRMQKLEKIQESLRDTLMLDDDVVAAKKEQLEESFRKRNAQMKSEVAYLNAKLNESMKDNLKLQKKIGQYRALDMLEFKTKDLPSYEARQVKKLLSEANADEIEAKFDKVLESVRHKANESIKDYTTTLESEISKIVDEDDVIKNRPHNLHRPMNEQEPEIDDEESTDNSNQPSSNNNHDDDDFETTEQIRYDDDGNVVLEESEVIDPRTMAMYCALAQERN